MTQLADPRSRHKRDKKRVFGFELITSLLTHTKYLIAKLKLANQISHEKQTLSSLNDYLLRDIGLTRDQVKTELDRGFFDLPSSRYSDFGFLQGGLGDSRRSRQRRLPKD